MSEVLRWPCTILKVEERHRTVYISGVGDKAITEVKSIGWFIVLDNYIGLPCGPTKPDFKPGDTIRLTAEKYP